MAEGINVGSLYISVEIDKNTLKQQEKVMEDFSKKLKATFEKNFTEGADVKIKTKFTKSFETAANDAEKIMSDVLIKISEKAEKSLGKTFGEDFKKMIQDVSKEVGVQTKVISESYSTAGKNVKNTASSFKQIKEEMKSTSVFSKQFSSDIENIHFSVNSLMFALSRLSFYLGTTYSPQRTVTDLISYNLTIEKGLREIAAVAGVAENDISSLREKYVKFASDSVNATEDLIGSFRLAVSSGIDLADAFSFLSKAEQLSLIGGTELKTAVDALTLVFDAFNKTVYDSDQILNVFKVGEVEGKQTIDEFAKSLGNVATAASNSGVSFEEVTASVSALSRVGLPTAKSTVGLASALNSIIKPSSEAQSLANKLGISFDLLTIKTQGWTGFLNQLKTELDDNKDKIADMGYTTNQVLTTLFGNVRGSRAVFSLLTNASDIYATSLEKIQNSTDEAQKATELLQKSLEALKTQTGNKLKSAFDDIAQSLGGVQKFFLEVVGNFADGISTASSLEKALLLLAPAFGSLIPIFLQITKLLSAFVTSNPFFGWATLIGTIIIPAVISLKSLLTGLFKDSTREAEIFSNSLNEINKYSQNIQANLDNVYEVLKKNENQTKDFNDAFDELNKAVSDYNDAVEFGTGNINDQQKIIDKIIEKYPSLNNILQEQNGLYDIQIEKINSIIELQKKQSETSIKIGEIQLKQAKEQFQALTTSEPVKQALGLREENGQIVSDALLNLEKIINDEQDKIKNINISEDYFDLAEKLSGALNLTKKYGESLTLPQRFDISEVLGQNLYNELLNTYKDTTIINSPEIRGFVDKKLVGIYEASFEPLTKFKSGNLTKDSLNKLETFRENLGNYFDAIDKIAEYQRNYSDLSAQYLEILNSQQNINEIESRIETAKETTKLYNDILSNSNKAESSYLTELKRLNELFKTSAQGGGVRESVLKEISATLGDLTDNLITQVISPEQLSNAFSQILTTAPDIAEAIKQLYPTLNKNLKYSADEIFKIKDAIDNVNKTTTVEDNGEKLLSNVKDLYNKFSDTLSTLKTAQNYNELLNYYDDLRKAFEVLPNESKALLPEITDALNDYDNKVKGYLMQQLEILLQEKQDSPKPETIANDILSLKNKISENLATATVEELNGYINEISGTLGKYSKDIQNLISPILNESTTKVTNRIKEITNNLYDVLIKDSESVINSLNADEISNKLKNLEDTYKNYLKKSISPEITSEEKITFKLLAEQANKALTVFQDGLAELFKNIDISKVTADDMSKYLELGGTLNKTFELNLDLTTLKNELIDTVSKTAQAISDPELYKQLRETSESALGSYAEAQALYLKGQTDEAIKMLNALDNFKKETERGVLQRQVTQQVNVVSGMTNAPLETQLKERRQLETLYQNAVESSVEISLAERISNQELISQLEDKVQIEETLYKIQKDTSDITTQNFEDALILVNDRINLYEKLISLGQNLNEEQENEYRNLQETQDSLKNLVDIKSKEEQLQKNLNSLSTAGLDSSVTLLQDNVNLIQTIIKLKGTSSEQDDKLLSDQKAELSNTKAKLKLIEDEAELKKEILELKSEIQALNEKYENVAEEERLNTVNKILKAYSELSDLQALSPQEQIQVTQFTKEKIGIEFTKDYKDVVTNAEKLSNLESENVNNQDYVLYIQSQRAKLYEDFVSKYKTMLTLDGVLTDEQKNQLKNYYLIQLAIEKDLKLTQEKLDTEEKISEALGVIQQFSSKPLIGTSQQNLTDINSVVEAFKTIEELQGLTVEQQKEYQNVLREQANIEVGIYDTNIESTSNNYLKLKYLKEQKTIFDSLLNTAELTTNQEEKLKEIIKEIADIELDTTTLQYEKQISAYDELLKTYDKDSVAYETVLNQKQMALNNYLNSFKQTFAEQGYVTDEQINKLEQLSNAVKIAQNEIAKIQIEKSLSGTQSKELKLSDISFFDLISGNASQAFKQSANDLQNQVGLYEKLLQSETDMLILKKQSLDVGELTNEEYEKAQENLNKTKEELVELRKEAERQEQIAESLDMAYSFLLDKIKEFTTSAFGGDAQAENIASGLTSAINLMTGIFTGNIAQIVSGAIGSLDSIFKYFSMNAEKLNKALETSQNFAKTLTEKMNQTYDKVYRTSFQNSKREREKELEEMKNQIKANEKLMSDSVEKWGAGFHKKELLALKKQNDELKAKIKELTGEDSARVETLSDLGVTADSISDALKRAFESNTYEDFINNFSSSLEAMTKQALIEGFTSKALSEEVIAKYVDDWYAKYKQYQGKIPEQELDNLTNELLSQIDGLKEFYEFIKDLDLGVGAGEITSVAQGLGTSLTEETANKLSGIFQTIRENSSLTNVLLQNLILNSEINTGTLNNIDLNVAAIRNLLEQGTLNVKIQPSEINISDESKYGGNI